MKDFLFHGVRWGTLRLFKSKPGDISPDSCWVLIDCAEPYMYDGNTFFELTKNVIKNWRKDSALAG